MRGLCLLLWTLTLKEKAVVQDVDWRKQQARRGSQAGGADSAGARSAVSAPLSTQDGGAEAGSSAAWGRRGKAPWRAPVPQFLPGRLLRWKFQEKAKGAGSGGAAV